MRMKSQPIVLAIVGSLLSCPAGATDEVSAIVNVLATTAARIRAISDSCKIAVDPSLEGQVIETLMELPGIKIGGVVSHFQQRRQAEASMRGSKCYPEDTEALSTLKGIYKSETASLKAVVAQIVAE
ncbi:hypothetical protein CFBP5875_19115 [Agrobacterium pusense]|uniref:hypothetical protein n=1 Tax=Agrobacterium pusense TaxID=648995 RepID=UPI0010BECFAB|nr:hypothetical protein [Agrobacterium pusense]QCL86712.1 hypothetical protein CFBP5875_19115 [Agrobacterium pusense]